MLFGGVGISGPIGARLELVTIPSYLEFVSTFTPVAGTQPLIWLNWCLYGFFCNVLLEHDETGPIGVIGTAFVQKLCSGLETVQDNPFGTECFKEQNIIAWKREHCGNECQAHMLV